jgi:hypothetical protein
MIRRQALACVFAPPFALLISNVYANDEIPKAAWKPPIGSLPENPGRGPLR